MKQFIARLLICMLWSSCTAQDIMDLQQMEVDQSISQTIEKLTILDRMADANYGLKSYQIRDLDGVSYGDVRFSEYQLPGGAIADYNNILLHVTDFSKNRFLGFTINLVKRQEGEALLNYLTEEFGKPESTVTKGHGVAYFWDADRDGKWIFFTSSTISLPRGGARTDVQCTIIKKGTRVENSLRQDVLPYWTTLIYHIPNNERNASEGVSILLGTD